MIYFASLPLTPDSCQIPFGVFFSIVQHRDNFTYVVSGVFEQQRRREGDWEFPEAGQMSRPKEEGNKGTGAPLTGWGGRSGKALFQYTINNQYLLRKKKEGVAGLGDSLLQTTCLELLDSSGAFGQHCGTTGPAW